jgi:hypothetical protein
MDGCNAPLGLDRQEHCPCAGADTCHAGARQVGRVQRPQSHIDETEQHEREQPPRAIPHVVHATGDNPACCRSLLMLRLMPSSMVNVGA